MNRRRLSRSFLLIDLSSFDKQGGKPQTPPLIRTRTNKLQDFFSPPKLQPYLEPTNFSTVCWTLCWFTREPICRHSAEALACLVPTLSLSDVVMSAALNSYGVVTLQTSHRPKHSLRTKFNSELSLRPSGTATQLLDSHIGLHSISEIYHHATYTQCTNNLGFASRYIWKIRVLLPPTEMLATSDVKQM